MGKQIAFVFMFLNSYIAVAQLNSIDVVKESIQAYKPNYRYSDIDFINKTIDMHFKKYNGLFLLYEKLNRNKEEIESVDVYLTYKGLFTEKIQSINDSEKNYYIANYSSDNSLMVINYLDERPEYYDATLDDYFWIYNLDSLANGILHKDSIYCKYCSNGHIIDDRLFYTRSNERDDFQGGYWLTDIYVSPLDNIADSVVIARNFGIRAISSDGKYILAQNKNTIDRYSCAIIDVESKRYQVLLGRDYYAQQVVYSDEEKKFGFVFGQKIVYVDMPKTFPFDALEKKDIFWPRPIGIEKKYEKTPLE